jgi:hypothetical protein
MSINRAKQLDSSCSRLVHVELMPVHHGMVPANGQNSMLAAHRLAVCLCRVYNVWHITHTRTLPGGAPLPPGLLWDAEPPSSLFEAWMPPMLKLQLLHLAKMQWDLRQGPAAASASPEDDSEQARDSKALERAVPRMASPCVAGELLQQRAPGLLPHTRRCKRQVPNRNGSGRRREVVEETLIKLSQTHLVNCLAAVSYYQRACQHDGRVFSPLGEQPPCGMVQTKNGAKVASIDSPTAQQMSLAQASCANPDAPCSSMLVPPLSTGC